MHSAAPLCTSTASRFLFEDGCARADAKSAFTAMAASLLLHVPLLPVVSLWAPDSRSAVKERNVTALFQAIVEQERIMPVDLESLGAGEPTTAVPSDGPAPGLARLTDDLCARGAVSTSVPAGAPPDGPAGAPGSASGNGADDTPLGLATRLAAPEAISARTGGNGAGSGLTPEEERAMRAKWFAWYRGVLGERLSATYPREALEAKGVRGTLAFRMDLAPDGAVKSYEVVRADAPAMRDALKTTLETIGRFPPYAATGLPFFPPFVFRIQHGPGQWKPTAAAPDRDGSAVCSVAY